MSKEDLKDIINNINYGKEQQGCYENTYLYFKVSAIESLVNENNQLKDRIEYLQKSISRKEETIIELRNELVETPKETELENIINNALAKITNMFDEGNEETIIDDLLELKKILERVN